MDYEKESLEYHAREPRGKTHTGLSKPVVTQRELSLAYTPGVAGPCREIAQDPAKSFLYTNRGNLVAVITNGTAVLGLGDIGPEAGKPVMEGKAVLFKKFADIDVFDIELNAPDPEAFIAAVKALEPTFGGINLEDIKAPECFHIEERLRAIMDIPVFHDDQHGTAIIAAAAFLNALELTGRDVARTTVVFSGAGAAAIATAKLFLSLGVAPDHLLMCDTKGVIHADRTDSLNAYKAQFARKTKLRTLADALTGADVFVGVSGPGVLSPEMLKGMAPHPIVFALANPDPEITPDEALKARPDAIVATGRSDYPNQVNNVLGFPFIFRGALDVGAREINEAMKIAAVKAIADLAKDDVPDEVMRAYGATLPYRFGRDYLIPKPVDPRVLLKVAPAVAQAAIESGVARRPIPMDVYQERIEQILGPTRRIIRERRKAIAAAKRQGHRPAVVIPHGHDERVIKAAMQAYYDGDVEVVLLGSIAQVTRNAEALGIKDFAAKVAIIDPLLSPRAEAYADQLHAMRARKGVTRGAAAQLLRNPNYYAAMMLRAGEVSGLLTGLVEPYAASLKPMLETIGTTPDEALCGVHMINYHRQLYFLADCTITVEPTAAELVAIAKTTARLAARYTPEPVHLAFLSFSSFGSNRHPKSRVVAEATEMLAREAPPFVFDGEVQADVALNAKLQEREFPFCRLGGSANVLIFPDLASANIAYKILNSLREVRGIGPLLTGPRLPVNVLERVATTEEIVNMIYITAEQAVAAAQATAGSGAAHRL